MPYYCIDIKNWWFGEYVPLFSILFVMRILIDAGHTTFNIEILWFLLQETTTYRPKKVLLVQAKAT